MTNFVAVYRTMYFTSAEHKQATCEYETTNRFTILASSRDEASDHAQCLLTSLRLHFPNNETSLEALFEVKPNGKQPSRR